MRRRLKKKHSQTETRDFISSSLLKKGFWVSTNTSRTKDNEFHMQCANFDMTKWVKILVSKSDNKVGVWMLHEKNEKYNSSELSYVFVGFVDYKGFLKTPKLFVVPSKIVSEYIIEDGRKYLSNPHRNIHRRYFVIKQNEEKKYLNKWNLLGLD